MILVRPGKLVTKFCWDVERYGMIDGSRDSCRKLLSDNKRSRVDKWRILTLLIIIIIGFCNNFNTF